MKKMKTFIVAAIVALTILPIGISAAPGRVLAIPAKTLPATTPADSAEARALLLRLDEIRSMDRTKLSENDKKTLHKEVKNIKRSLKDISGGVYLSAGTILIVLLLLILLT